jgi:hypothetical protein
MGQDSLTVARRDQNRCHIGLGFADLVPMFLIPDLRHTTGGPMPSRRVRGRSRRLGGRRVRRATVGMAAAAGASRGVPIAGQFASDGGDEGDDRNAEEGRNPAAEFGNEGNERN